MPRSNKKRNLQKPTPKHPTTNSDFNNEDNITSLLIMERNLMISRSLLNGKMHGLNLKPGSPIPGTGDCALESVIINNNERNCFKEKLLLPINQ